MPQAQLAITLVELAGMQLKLMLTQHKLWLARFGSPSLRH